MNSGSTWRALHSRLSSFQVEFQASSFQHSGKQEFEHPLAERKGEIVKTFGLNAQIPIFPSKFEKPGGNHTCRMSSYGSGGEIGPLLLSELRLKTYLVAEAHWLL